MIKLIFGLIIITFSAYEINGVLINHFTCRDDFGYYPHETDCTMYYVCLFRTPTIFNCTEGLYFNVEYQTCDWQTNVKCKEGYRNITTTPSVEEEDEPYYQTNNYRRYGRNEQVTDRRQHDSYRRTTASTTTSTTTTTTERPYQQSEEENSDYQQISTFGFDSLEKENIYQPDPPANRIPVRVFSVTGDPTTTTTTKKPGSQFRSVIEHRVENGDSGESDGVLVLGAISKGDLDYNPQPIQRNTSNGLIYEQEPSSVREGRVRFPQSLDDSHSESLDAQFGINPTSVSLPDPPLQSSAGKRPNPHFQFQQDGNDDKKSDFYDGFFLTKDYNRRLATPRPAQERQPVRQQRPQKQREPQEQDDRLTYYQPDFRQTEYDSDPIHAQRVRGPETSYEPEPSRQRRPETEGPRRPGPELPRRPDLNRPRRPVPEQSRRPEQDYNPPPQRLQHPDTDYSERERPQAPKRQQSNVFTARRQPVRKPVTQYRRPDRPRRPTTDYHQKPTRPTQRPYRRPTRPASVTDYEPHVYESAPYRRPTTRVIPPITTTTTTSTTTTTTTRPPRTRAPLRTRYRKPSKVKVPDIPSLIGDFHEDDQRQDDQFNNKRRRPVSNRHPQSKKSSRPSRPKYEKLASRPAPLYDTPIPKTPAQKCDPQKCALPDCYCGGPTIPNNMPKDKVPQIILLTFDDALNDLNWKLYQDIFYAGRSNPNGCPILGTFYVSHEWTDYGKVQTMYSNGHEMASHSISHSFGEKFSKKKWHKEINGMREVLNGYSGVKLEDVRGMRAPFLQIGGNRMYEMLYDANFTYDSSMPVYENNPPYWPHTLDYAIPHECMITPCPTQSFPGLWQVPMVMLLDERGGRCSMADACSNPADEDGIYRILLKNFNRHYKTNRAPFGLFYHAAWFTTAHHKAGFLKFLDDITSRDDVWLVTNWQAIQWMRNPTSLDNIHNFEPFQCEKDDGRPPTCPRPKVCNLWHKSGVRYMKTCQKCPDVYPWTGKTGVKIKY